jgi:hypothetical protein
MGQPKEVKGKVLSVNLVKGGDAGAVRNRYAGFQLDHRCCGTTGAFNHYQQLGPLRGKSSWAVR